jgi:hypothetical protein
MRRLVDAALRRNMKFILDVVTTMWQLFFYVINGNGSPRRHPHGFGNHSPLTSITEWDPDYDSRGIRAGPRWAKAAGAHRVGEHAGITHPPNPSKFHQRQLVSPARPRHRWDRAGCMQRKRISQARLSKDTPCNNSISEQEVYGDFPVGLKDLATET